MRYRITPLARVAAIIALIFSWGIFLVLRTTVLDRVREFPGWGNFLVIDWGRSDIQEDTTSFVVSTVVPTSFINPMRATAPAIVIVPTNPRRPASTLPVSSNVDSAVRQNASRNVGYPTQCENSVETRFRSGDSGYTDPQRNVRLRPRPGDDQGTNLAPGTNFVMTGNPVCADLYGNSWNNYLWWPVRLTSGSASGQSGWLAESVISEGQLFVHLFPN